MKALLEVQGKTLGWSLSLQPFPPPDARTLGPHPPLPCRPRAFTSPRPLLSVRAHVPGPSGPQEVTQGLGVLLGLVSLKLAPWVTLGARRGTGGAGEPLLLGGPRGRAPPHPSVPGSGSRPPPASVGSLGSSSGATSPTWTTAPLVPGAAQEVGGEGRRHDSR